MAKDLIFKCEAWNLLALKQENKKCVFFSLVVTNIFIKCITKIMVVKQFVYLFEFELFIYGLSVLCHFVYVSCLIFLMFIFFFAFFDLYVFAIVMCCFF